MERYQEEFRRIKELLKENPKGMTITEISRELKINRNSCAKYLDLLTVLGNVEMRTFGTAKVFYLADKVPISTLINITSDGILILNKELKIIKVNDRFLDWIKLEKENLINKNINNINHDFFVDIKEKLGTEKNLKEEIIFEKEFVNDRETRYCQGSIIPVILNEIEPGICIKLKDITPQKKVELELKKSEEQYRLILNSMTDAIHVVDLNLKIIYINPPFKKWLKELKLQPISIGKTVFENFPFLPKELHSEYEKIIKTGKPLYTKGKIEIRGKEIFTETNKIPIFREGKVIQVLTIIRDITSKHIAEKKLKDSEEKFRRIYESIPDIYFLVSKDNTIVEYKGELTQVFSPGAFLGKKIVQYLPKDLRDTASEKIKLVLKTKKPQIMEYSQIINNKLMYFEARALYFSEDRVGIFIRNITDRKLAEEKLKESEEKFRSIANQSLMGIFVIQDGIIKYVNKAIEGLTGYSVKELTSWGPEEYKKVIYPEDQDYVMDIARRLRRGDKNVPNHLNFRIITKDGKIRHWDLYVKRVHFQGSNADLSTVIDITEQKEMELKLKESEEKFRTIAEQSIMGICIVQDKEVKYFNNTFADIFGYLPEEISKWSADEYQKLIHIEDRDKIIKKIRAQINSKKGKKIQYSFRGITKSGKIIWVENYTRRITYKGRSANLIMISDITERRKAIQKMKEATERYVAIFNRSHYAIYVHDFKGNFLEANKKAFELLGYNKDEIHKLNFEKIIIKEQVPKAFEILNRFIKNPTLKERFEFKIKRKNGKYIWVETEGSLLYKEGKPYAILGIANDITKRKKLEMAIQ
ncbi:MAG: PAS domain S-box protein [Candidatus Helarchaeota archaeon]